MSDQQKLRKVELIQYPRGSILDRHGDTITNTTAAPALIIVPSLVNNPVTVAETLAAIVNVEDGLLLNKIVGENQAGEEVRYLPFVAKSNLTGAEITTVESLHDDGVMVLNQTGRYQTDLPALHILGSLGTVTSDDVATGKYEDYEAGETVGVTGLERLYEDVLHGSGGRSLGIIVDDKNQAVFDDEYLLFNETEQNAGYLVTTLDLSIQRALEDAMGDQQGAAVVLAADNGDVLALLSSPKYDPYYMVPPSTNDAYVNRALSAYPAASLFKLLIASLALSEGVVQPESTFYCNGAYTLQNGDTIACWKEDGHGLITFDEAIAKSCNPVFVHLAQTLGREKIIEAFSKWELDVDHLIGYPLSSLSSIQIEGSGEAVLGNIALGEQGVMMTPLNLAKMIHCIAAGGLLRSPRLVAEVYNAEGLLVKGYPASLPLRVLDSAVANRVADMMLQTFQDGGTGASLGLAGLAIAGKTGTSETGNVWIGGFFPRQEPRYVVVILVEGGSSGVGDAGPVFKKICAYLNGMQDTT